MPIRGPGSPSIHNPASPSTTPLGWQPRTSTPPQLPPRNQNQAPLGLSTRTSNASGARPRVSLPPPKSQQAINAFNSNASSSSITPSTQKPAAQGAGEKPEVPPKSARANAFMVAKQSTAAGLSAGAQPAIAAALSAGLHGAMTAAKTPGPPQARAAAMAVAMAKPALSAALKAGGEPALSAMVSKAKESLHHTGSHQAATGAEKPPVPAKSAQVQEYAREHANKLDAARASAQPSAQEAKHAQGAEAAAEQQKTESHSSASQDSSPADKTHQAGSDYVQAMRENADREQRNTLLQSQIGSESKLFDAFAKQLISGAESIEKLIDK